MKNKNNATSTTVIVWSSFALICFLAYLFSFLLRFDWNIPVEHRQSINQSIVIVPVLQFVALFIFRQLAIVPWYFGFNDIIPLVRANIIGSLISFVINSFFGYRVPKGVFLIDAILLICGCVFVRCVFRYFAIFSISGFRCFGGGKSHCEPVVIVGANESGSSLCREINYISPSKMRIVGFLDDDPKTWGRTLHGFKVLGSPDIISSPGVSAFVRKVIIATSSIPVKRVAEIARMCAINGIKSERLPPIDQLVTGRLKVLQTKAIQIDDLLRRPPVAVDQKITESGLFGKVVMVTGAGGSIGSELCRQILANKPWKLLLIERCEVQIFQIEQELREKFGNNVVVPLVVDVTNRRELEWVFKKYSPNVVFHAAAHKHVPLMEEHLIEAVYNNTYGTVNMVRFASKYKVDKLIFVSTDKAVNPTNIMGASKRLAEIYLQHYQNRIGNCTRFMVVRFGNVLGSSGSVVPTFLKQINRGGPVTVTHPEVTRFFMTIPEAVGLVIQSSMLGSGGEIYVLDMGEPVRIYDLARQMIELSGQKVNEDIEIVITGLRPGEKMFEELSHKGEVMEKTSHPRIFRYHATDLDRVDLEEIYDSMYNDVLHGERDKVGRTLVQLVPGYTPYFRKSPAVQ